MARITVKGDRPFGAGDIADAADLWRRKVPSLTDFTDRPKRRHELD